jgi:hypothetical protein
MSAIALLWLIIGFGILVFWAVRYIKKHRPYYTRPQGVDTVLLLSVMGMIFCTSMLFFPEQWIKAAMLAMLGGLITEMVTIFVDELPPDEEMREQIASFVRRFISR